MAYIGQGIKQGTFKVLDTSGNTYNGSNVTFSLGTQVGSAAQLLVSHDGVIQLPGTDYTLATGGTQITFSTAPASGASIFIVEISGAVGGTVTPSDASVTADKLNSAVLTGLTDIGAGIADADLFLVDDGAGGTLRKVAASRLSTYISPTSATDSFTINGSTPTLTIGDAGAEDTKIVFDGNAQDYYIALDDSADDLILGKGSTVGTTPIISMADDGDTKITSTSTATGDAALELHSTGNSNGNYTNLKFTSAGNTTGTFIKSNQAGSGNAGRFEFWVNNDGTSQEAMRLTYNGIAKINSRAIIDAETNSSAKLGVEFGGNSELGISFNDKDGASNGRFIEFDRGGTEIGQIKRDGTNDAISYVTSSDYRLKDGVVDKTDGIEKIKLLKPRKFYWKSNADKTLVDGFLAHEVSGIVPEAISGIKDETKTLQKVVVSASGDIVRTNIEEADWTQGKTDGVYANNTTWEATKEVIKPQGIDQSKLVPLLTAALQEAVTKIEALEARVTTLEG
jgi:hypothetical protein